MLSLIPVLDLMRGQAVRAIRGERQAYQPLRTALCPVSEPIDVARRLLAATGAPPGAQAHPPTLYLADLDALMGGEAQLPVLSALLEAWPDLQLWLDAGFSDPRAARDLCARLPARAAARVRVVYASESLSDLAALTSAFAPQERGPLGPVLSLDRRGGAHLDRAGCWQHPECWPDTLIVMSLDHVGAGAGPDLKTLRAVREQAPAATLVGAGGVRDAADLAAAEAAGAQAWLVATALHDLSLP